MIKLLPNHKVRLNHILRLAWINLIACSFFVTASYGHGLTATNVKTRAIIQAMLVTGTITDEAGLPVPGGRR